ncbi:MAG: nucleotidyltransferase, partial [Clostridia bacterium]|nr:nucleotidyltransferase [Clostridia bacterium]
NGTVSRGVCQTTDGKLDSIVERTKIIKEGDTARYYEGDTFVDFPLDTPVSMNFWGFTPTVFEGLEDYFKCFLEERGTELKSEALLPNTIGKMIKEDKCSVSVLSTDSKWFGVTYAEDKPGTIAKIKDLIASGVYPDGLWK